MHAYFCCKRLNSPSASPVLEIRTSIPFERRASSVSSGISIRAIITGIDHQYIRAIGQHGAEVLPVEAMSLTPPPIVLGTFRKYDHIGFKFMAVNIDTAEGVTFDFHN